jgi:hypothetical protein
MGTVTFVHGDDAHMPVSSEDEGTLTVSGQCMLPQHLTVLQYEMNLATIEHFCCEILEGKNDH